MEGQVITAEDFEKFQAAETLEANAGEDPEEEPFKSRYAARASLQELQQSLEKVLESRVPEEMECGVRGAVAGVLCVLGKNFVRTEERPAGLELCIRALRLLLPEEESQLSSVVQPVFSSILLEILNYLGFVYESLSDHDNAVLRLKQAEQVFCVYQEQYEGFVPLNLKTLLQQLAGLQGTEADEALWKEFEAQHTYTVYYLAQVYKNTAELSLAAEYCGRTLRRQLEAGDFDPIDWALNAATLSQYFIGTPDNENFRQARHCLASAEVVILEHEQRMKARQAEIPLEDDEERVEAVQNCKADVFRCWAKYGIVLLECSREDLGKPEEERVANKLELVDLDSEKTWRDLEWDFEKFLDLDATEGQIGCRLVTRFQDARPVFLCVQSWLNQARRFFTKDYRASDFVEIAQDTSRAFKALAFFEEDLERKCKMHKRRLDLLKESLDELNPSFYLLISRQLSFELGEIASEILSLKLDLADTKNPKNAPLTLHQMQKINWLADQGIKYFQGFLDSFKNHEGRLPAKFPPECVRPCILAHFYMARCWSKKATADVREKQIFLNLSLEEYKWIVHYCDSVDEAGKEAVAEELEACRDMVHLLPVKLDRLQRL